MGARRYVLRHRGTGRVERFTSAWQVRTFLALHPLPGLWDCRVVGVAGPSFSAATNPERGSSCGSPTGPDAGQPVAGIPAATPPGGSGRDLLPTA